VCPMTDDREPGSTPVEEPDPLLEELRRIASLVEPIPPGTVEAGRAAFAWRTIDAELAALVHDSLVDTSAAGLRGGEELLLSFESDHMLIEVRVVRGGADRELVGQVAASGEPSFRVVPAMLTVEHPGGDLSVQSDEYGRFTVGGVAPGPVRLRCRPPQPAPQVVTDWVTI
jgi:hypothetical protein